MATFRVQDAEPLDAVDRHILRLLQADGRRTNVDIAREVGLTPSPCLRRIRSLEERGFISGYSAVLNPVLLRRNLVINVEVELADQRRETMAAFEDAVLALDDVQACYLISGEADYLLTVAVADLDAYHKVFSEKLGELPGVTSIKSLITMKAVKEGRTLPV
ncbi:Lrp/AsnC family transcriptional regulator [Propioniciclava tarda]|uniref:Lrp/AsnC family transcriptional regulator n=1 Tax=Propioniciclava tarda TaxID=433330 RepID=UPI00116FF155|nr:Lrp/AsnC family transcriptional regulator [Propioniciclava tarda]SMO34596.1 transcriptional regulator, AsnC family [Propioniciclava tarda]HOA90102.1 Lrp/AsnC family transcriptional regulator [Propioniciclava tarda]HQD61936.1 Lrp/AsnC family transcriptional regulator [Propioniciclava tarda]